MLLIRALGDGDGGFFLHGADAAPPRNLVGAVVLHSQHGDGDARLYPAGDDLGTGIVAAVLLHRQHGEPGRVQLFLHVGGDAGGEDGVGQQPCPRVRRGRACDRDSLGADDLGSGHPTTPRHAGGTDLQAVILRSRHEDEMVVRERERELCDMDEDGDGHGDDLGTGWFRLHAPRRNLVDGDPDGDLVVLLFLDADLDLTSWRDVARPRNRDDKIGGRVRLLGGEDLERSVEDTGTSEEEVERRVRLPIAPCHHGDGLRGGSISHYYCSDDDASSEFSWKHVLGYAMVQTVSNSCALVAATVCLEAQHRLEFEKVNGRGTFPCRAAAPRKLRSACFHDRYWDSSTKEYRRTWHPQDGANTPRVLDMLMRLGGARTTNAPPPAPFFLPLEHWWYHHNYCNSFATPDVVVKLLFEHGPCIGSLFIVPSQFYKSFGSNIAFRGCRREDRHKIEEKEHAGMHAVVCYAYRRRNKGNGFDILVLDNQRPIGSSKWVEFEEFDTFYMLYVRSLPRSHLLDRALPPVYPFSIW